MQHLASSIFTFEHLRISDLRILPLRIGIASARLHISDPHISDCHILHLHIFYRVICVTSANLHISDPHISDLHILNLRICVPSAHLHFSDLHIFTFTVRSSCLETTYLVFTSSDLHHVVTLSNLIIFKIHVHNLIYLRFQIFTSLNIVSSLWGQPSFSLNVKSVAVQSN